jgi:hypothetical protein
MHAPQEKQEGSMTVITAGRPPVRWGWIRKFLQTFAYKLITALDQYGQTRVHHTASRAQMRRAQHDLIRVRRAMHSRNAGAPYKKAATEPVTGQ